MLTLRFIDAFHAPRSTLLTIVIPLIFITSFVFIAPLAKAELTESSDVNQQLISLNAELYGADAGREAQTTTRVTGSSQVNELLTIDEVQWLKNHPDLTLWSDNYWPPFEFIDENGVYSGMIRDVISLLEERLDYKFKISQKASWSETLEGIQNGELSLVTAVAKTPQREEYMLFTEPYFSFPIVMVIREGLGFVIDLRELDDERVGVVKGYASYDYLIINHPDLNLQVVENVEQGLQALSDGDLDVFVSNIPSVSYLIKKLGIFNVRLTSITPYIYDLRVGVNSDHPEMVSILNKAIASIPRQEFDDIYKDWLFRDFEVQVDYRIVRRIAFISILVIGIFLYWNRKLSKEVTERIRSEKALMLSKDQLRQATYDAELMARKADEANQAKSIFLANMSHEIRTPMNAVMGYTELLAAAVKDKKQKSYLESIRAGSKALLTLINDILDLSKVEAGKLQIEYRAISLRPLFDELQSMFSAKVEGKKLQLLVELSPELPNVVMLDETRLRQILFNLVGNAIKFTHKGSIYVRASTNPSAAARTSTEPNSVDITIEVEDSGIGVPYDQHERIFRAFEQQEGQSTRDYGGTGLGLAISKKLVEMMGGELLLRSEVNQGSCFTVKLTNVVVASIEQQLSAGLPIVSQYQFEPANILVVDDIALNRQLVNDLLEGTGFSIKQAENGLQAIQIAEVWRPDLILMDIRMPVMDGYEATSTLKQRSDTQKIPIVALTASVMNKDEYKIEEAGFDGYLKKPVSGSELYAEIASFLPHSIVHEQGEMQSTSSVTTNNLSDSLQKEQENLPLSFDSSVRKYIREQFLAHWAQVNGSGDIAAVALFAEALQGAADEGRLVSLGAYASELKSAADAFDLDKMQNLLGSFERRIVG